MPDNDKRTELDKLDIDELIEQTENTIEEEQAKEKKDSEQVVSEEEKPKKKLPLKLIICVLLGIIILIFISLIILELLKKYPVKSGFYKIDKNVVWLSKKKIEEVKIKSQIKTYQINLKLAYKFSSINGIKILSTTLFTKFTSKTNIPVDKLYEIIKMDIYKQFSAITANKYIEDLPEYGKVLSEIIKNTTIKVLKNVIPDIDLKEVKKNLNFTNFVIN